MPLAETILSEMIRQHVDCTSYCVLLNIICRLEEHIDLCVLLCTRTGHGITAYGAFGQKKLKLESILGLSLLYGHDMYS